jgi:hypothetical protein
MLPKLFLLVSLMKALQHAAGSRGIDSEVRFMDKSDGVILSWRDNDHLARCEVQLVLQDERIFARIKCNEQSKNLDPFGERPHAYELASWSSGVDYAKNAIDEALALRS